MLFSKREYKSGTSWGLWLWTFTPSGYITRLHLIKTPWFAICLHWINHPDAEPHLHDHPVSFLSVILRGWYTELRPLHSDSAIKVVYLRNWFNVLRANRIDRHRIIGVPSKGTLTLCFMGPKRQDWGFYTPEGWVYWKKYNVEKYR